MNYWTSKRIIRLFALLGLAVVCLTSFTGCPRNQTTLDDRPLDQRPHIETEQPDKRGDPFRP